MPPERGLIFAAHISRDGLNGHRARLQLLLGFLDPQRLDMSQRAVTRCNPKSAIKCPLEQA